MMPTIHYDGLVFAMQSVGGISRYFAALMARVAAVAPVSLTLRYGRGCPAELAGRVRVVPVALLPDHMGGQGRWSSRVYGWLRPWQTAWLEHRLRRGPARPAVFHPTYYTRPWCDDLPMVATAYDMIHERLPGEFTGPEWERFRAAKAACLRAAAHVVCISATTQADVIEQLGLHPSKTSVIPLAATEVSGTGPPPTTAAEITKAQRARHPDGRRGAFALYVGQRGGYKNFAVLLTAWHLWSRRREMALIAIGGEPVWSPAEAAAVTALQAQGSQVRHVAGVNDRQLVRWYRQCHMVVCPSRYEGFGLPVIEALAQGAVVVGARAGSLPEVAGPHALYFDPTNPAELVDTLDRAAQLNAAQRADWSARARAWAARYSWDRTAAATLDVYRQVARS